MMKTSGWVWHLLKILLSSWCAFCVNHIVNIADILTVRFNRWQSWNIRVRFHLHHFLIFVFSSNASPPLSWGKFSQFFLPGRWYLRVVLGEIFPPWQVIVVGDRLWWLLSNLAPSPMIVRNSLSGWVVNFHYALVMFFPKVLTPPGPMAVDWISCIVVVMETSMQMEPKNTWSILIKIVRVLFN